MAEWIQQWTCDGCLGNVAWSADRDGVSIRTEDRASVPARIGSALDCPMGMWMRRGHQRWESSECGTVSEQGLDPRGFLERLQGEHQTLRWSPLPPEFPEQWRQVPLAGSESLRYLHEHWVLTDAPAGSGGGVRGRLASVAGRVVFRALARYLQDERELLGHLVRMNDALARRCDELARTVADRQVADAENQAHLAAWLQAKLSTEGNGIPSPEGDARS